MLSFECSVLLPLHTLMLLLLRCISNRSNQSTPGDVVIANSVRSADAGEPAIFKPKVLIVDDSSMNRRMLSHMLGSAGFECVDAVDGLAAVAYVKRAGLHSRYTALAAPDSDLIIETVRAVIANRREGGCLSPANEAAEMISSRPSLTELTPRRERPPDVILMDSNMPKMNGPDAIVEIRKLGYKFPIIGVSGDEDQAGFMRAGVDGVMMKPVKGDQLVNMINLALRKVETPLT